MHCYSPNFHTLVLVPLPIRTLELKHYFSPTMSKLLRNVRAALQTMNLTVAPSIDPRIKLWIEITQWGCDPRKFRESMEKGDKQRKKCS